MAPYLFWKKIAVVLREHNINQYQCDVVRLDNSNAILLISNPDILRIQNGYRVSARIDTALHATVDVASRHLRVTMRYPHRYSLHIIIHLFCREELE